MGLGEIPARSDPCWDDEKWRWATLRQIRKRHKLSAKSIADLTGCKTATVYIWFVRDTPRPIPANTLRALLFDLVGES